MKFQTQGSFTANQALDSGLIYYISKLDPLGDLMESNKGDESKAIMKQKWGKDTSMEKFNNKTSISDGAYSNLLSQRKERMTFGDDFKKEVQHLKEDFLDIAKTAFRRTNYDHENNRKGEKVVILRINGEINEKIHDNTVNTLQKVEKDKSIECVVLRVNSPGAPLVHLSVFGKSATVFLSQSSAQCPIFALRVVIIL